MRYSLESAKFSARRSFADRKTLLARATGNVKNVARVQRLSPMLVLVVVRSFGIGFD